MQSLHFQLFLVFCLTNFRFAEPVNKCYGCIAGPFLTTATGYDNRCKSGKLDGNYQYTCNNRNSRKADTLELLNATEIEQREHNLDQAEYSFACATATVKGNGSELFTVRSCIYDDTLNQSTNDKAVYVCEKHSEENVVQMLVEKLKPNLQNLVHGHPFEDHFIFDGNIEISADLCTCSTDACNSSNNLFFKFCNLLLVTTLCFIGKLCCAYLI